MSLNFFFQKGIKRVQNHFCFAPPQGDKNYKNYEKVVNHGASGATFLKKVKKGASL